MLTSREHNDKRFCRKCSLSVLVATLVLLVGAAQGSCHDSNSSSDGSSSSTSSPNASGLTTNVSQSEYSAYLTRYWDGIDPDTLSDEVREQRLVDYVYLTINADSALRRQCWQTLAQVFDKQQPNHTVVDYLGEPDSPLYAPAMLDEYLETIAALFAEGSARRLRVEYLLDGIRKNRPGTTIADLALIDATTGTRTTLHRAISLSTSSPVQVLFYDPDCDECAALIDRLAASTTPVIAISVTGTALPSASLSSSPNRTLPTTWLSFIAAYADQLDENFYLPSLPRLYTVSPTAQILKL